MMTLQELYAGPCTWTQDTLARDRAGNPVMLDDARAVSWCLYGGLLRCYDASTPEYRQACDQLREYTGGIVTYNNAPGRTIDEIRDLVRELDV